MVLTTEMLPSKVIIFFSWEANTLLNLLLPHYILLSFGYFVKQDMSHSFPSYPTWQFWFGKGWCYISFTGQIINLFLCWPHKTLLCSISFPSFCISGNWCLFTFSRRSIQMDWSTQWFDRTSPFNLPVNPRQSRVETQQRRYALLCLDSVVTAAIVMRSSLRWFQ